MIHIRPISGQQIEIEAEGQIFGEFHTDEAIEAMEALHAEYPGQIELSTKGYGFSVTAPVVAKALELAGLEGFQAAKQQATGKVVF